MPNVSAMNMFGATEMSQPLFRLPTNRPDTPASAAPVTHPAEPAANGSRPSPELEKLCHQISDASKARQARATRFTKQFSAYQQSDLTQMLTKAGGSAKVERSHPHNLELNTSLGNDRRPVVILDTFGYPQYVFEHVDGQWRGFDGALRPLPPGKNDPVAMLTSLISSGPMGLVFTRYVLNDNVSVLQPSVSPAPSAHDSEGLTHA